jgi:hypothetical protein
MTDHNFDHIQECSDKKIIYISLGSDCAVAYQLDKYYLRRWSFPFDWIQINNIDDLCNILENGFSNFIDFDFIEIKENPNDVYFNSKKQLSKKKLVHKLYKIIFPHEANEEHINVEEIKEKYERRIKRFIDICKDKKIKKIFVRSDKKYNKIKNDKLINSLDKICINYQLINIDYSKYVCKDEFTWQREYIPWINIFNI